MSVIKTVISTGYLVVLLGLSQLAIADLPDLENTAWQVEKQEELLEERIGVAVFSPVAKHLWHHRGDDRVPITSTFKMLLCALYLLKVDDNYDLLSKPLPVDSTMLVPHSPVIGWYIDQTIPMSDACSAALVTNDNASANAVLKVVGGPQA